jgi:thiamine pyrophosphate-dependent acetolactate synthase large subunit-like protein
MSATTMRLDRREVVRELMKDRGDLVVIAGLGSPGYDLFAAGDHDGNFYLWGAMGGAAMMGLGLAFAQRNRPVLVLTGDGEQLMGLGSLATVAAQKPENLSIVVLDNGHYAETGMQKSHTGLGIDLHRMAEAAGFKAREVVAMQEVAALRREIAQATGGPRFATIRISAEDTPRALSERDGVFQKTRFRTHLGIAMP